jgi:hypothetical protein
MTIQYLSAMPHTACDLSGRLTWWEGILFRGLFGAPAFRTAYVPVSIPVEGRWLGAFASRTWLANNGDVGTAIEWNGKEHGQGACNF